MFFESLRSFGEAGDFGTHGSVGVLLWRFTPHGQRQCCGLGHLAQLLPRRVQGLMMAQYSSALATDLQSANNVPQWTCLAV
jgi:hypothetical protein